MRTNLSLLAVLIVAFCALYIRSQNLEEKTDQPVALGGTWYNPVNYGNENDGLPEKIKGRGEIVEVTDSFMDCGAIGWNGTAKIKLLKKHKSYPHEYVYVAAWCGVIMKDNLNKVIELELVKLQKGEMGGGVAFNSINSNGVAFYRFNKIFNNR